MTRPMGASSAGDSHGLAGYGAAVAGLHLAGWGLCLAYSGTHPALLGLGLSAYLFGSRHAFDADHIAAVDDSVRLLLARERSSLGAGFFFALGHSSVVFVLALCSAFAAALLARHLHGLQAVGAMLGNLISGLFLWIVGLLNLATLLGMLQLWRRRHVVHSHARLDELLGRRGLLNRLLGRRMGRWVRHSWQMYPVGVLFGLGFDTASEIALLVLTGGAAAGAMPLPALISLPLLFTAAMTLLDTADGVLMSHAYGWALGDPVRRIFYNAATTLLAVTFALGIGSIELMRALAPALDLHGGAAALCRRLSLGSLGYILVGTFAVAWALSYASWRVGGPGALTRKLFAASGRTG